MFNTSLATYPLTTITGLFNAADAHILRASNALVDTLRGARHDLIERDFNADVETAVNRFGGGAVGVYASAMLKLDVVHQSPLPPGPKIFAPNHPTTIDPFFLLAYAGEPLTILITEMAFRVPGFGQYLEAAGHIRVDEGNGRAAFEQAIETVKSGRSIGVFPEGALSPREGGLCRARTGAARLALLTGAPIVPVGITMDRERIQVVETHVDHLTEEARWYLRGPYAVTIGRPLALAGSVEDREYVRDMSGEILRRIGQLTRESASRLHARGIPMHAVAGLAGG